MPHVRMSGGGTEEGGKEGEMVRTSKELVQLDEQFEVRVVALGSFAVPGPHMVLVEIDTCCGLPWSVIAFIARRGCGETARET